MLRFSQAAQSMRSSEIRRLMSLAADPSIISFSGGMPNGELFPLGAVDEIYGSLPLALKQTAFQYSPTAGFPPLLESLKAYLRSMGIPLDGQGLIITTGAQQAINLVAKIMIDPGHVVLTEYPSFIGAVAAFRSYGAQLQGIVMDQEGIVPAALEETARLHAGARLLYINTNFHNPAGILYSHDRKRVILDFIKKSGMVLLEDDPYHELYFDPRDKDAVTPIKAMADPSLPICYTGSFAKILGPGMRLGWLVGPAAIVEKCELAKQSMDACSPAFTQVLANEFLTRGKLGPYLDMLRPTYARRASIMLSALQRHLPQGVAWTTPRGGFYVWVTLPRFLDATAVFNIALKNGAAFVIGSAFDPQGTKNDCLRLAFSHTPEEKIAEGVRIIAEAVKALI